MRDKELLNVVFAESVTDAFSAVDKLAHTVGISRAAAATALTAAMRVVHKAVTIDSEESLLLAVAQARKEQEHG